MSIFFIKLSFGVGIMKESSIIYRPIKASDYKFLENIIKETWNYNRLGTDKLAKKLAKVYLASCLSNQTFTSVALVNDEPVGVIMAKNKLKHNIPIKYNIRKWIAIFEIIIAKDSREIAKIFQEVDEIDKILFKRVSKKFDCELAFFVVDQKQRGSGIGKELYQQFLNYMSSEGLDTFYLFTDTTCNYSFYERKGLKRLAQEKLDIPILQKDMQFYVYGNIKR